MPQSDSGIPYPSASAAPNGAAALMEMAEFLDVHTVLHATDEADRDARWGDVPAPVLVASKARPAVWLKVSNNGTSLDWRTVFEDTGVLVDGTQITPASGWDIGDPYFRRKNNVVSVSFTLTRTGPDISSNANGNITNVLIGNIINGWRPILAQPLIPTTAGQYLGCFAFRDGTVFIGHMLPGVTLSSGATFRLGGQWMTEGL